VRKWIIGGAVVVTGVLVAGVTLTWWRSWTYGLPHPDKATLVVEVAALATFLLTVLAAGVALVAFVVATGRPELTMTLRFINQADNTAHFKFDRPTNQPGAAMILQDGQQDGQLTLTNNARYSALNPGIRIDYIDCGVMERLGWDVVSTVPGLSITSIQWDGTIIHGRWQRTINVSVVGLRVVRPDAKPRIDITYVADRLAPKTVSILVTGHEQLLATMMKPGAAS